MEVSLRPLVEIGKKEFSIQILYIYFKGLQADCSLWQEGGFKWLRDYQEEVQKQGGTRADLTKFKYSLPKLSQSLLTVLNCNKDL